MAEHRDRALVSAESDALDDAIRDAIGYRVVESGRDVGAVVGVPDAGRPLRPLVLVVRAGDTMRFVSLQRVVAVLRTPRLLVLRPEMGPPPDGDLEPTRPRSVSSGPVTERSRQ